MTYADDSVIISNIYISIYSRRFDEYSKGTHQLLVQIGITINAGK